MLGALNPPPRYLLGAGPGPVEPSVLHALGKPLLAPDDPELARILRDTAESLRAAFRSSHPLTVAFAGGRAAAAEAALANLVEPNAPVVVGITGEGGRRLAEGARRAGGRVTEVVAGPGEAVETGALAEATKSRGARVVIVVAADPATGVRQPLEGLRAALGPEPLLVVDATLAVGGIPLEVSGWGIDACFATPELCLGVPPGLALITLSPRAEEAARGRSGPTRPWHLDLDLLRRPWDGEPGGEQHTVPVPLVYALHEGLRLVLREGLEVRWRRHAETGRFLQEALEDLGFRIVATSEHRLPQLTAALLPKGVEDGLRSVLLRDFDIHVDGGVGELAGKAWRIGLVGFGARREHALRLLQALRALLTTPGRPRG